jgi:type IV pilus assembly protein PilW
MRIKQSENGFGIVEIMIALALGVVIMLGVTQIATNNSNTRYELDRAGRQLENAAFALREMENDLTNAGYWGEMGAQTVGALPPVCPTTACDAFTGSPGTIDAAALNDLTSDCDLNRALRFPLQGGRIASGVLEEFACDTVDTADADEIVPKPGTDFIAVRRANSCALGTPGCETAGSNFYLQVHSCFRPGVSSAPLPGVSYAIDQIVTTPDAGVFKYEAYSADNCDSAAAAPHYRFLNRIYYINSDDQLMRAELEWNPIAAAHEYQQAVLVEGVEAMRLEYGLDSAGNDGQVDTYTNDPNAPDPTAWTDVVMVRIALVVRSAEPSPGFTDNKDYQLAGAQYLVPEEFENHRRQVYSRTVSVRNVAGRRG